MTTTILVVDDKASVRKVVRDYLTEEGFRAVTAENGREALYVARHEKPDLILLDIMMPEMGGYEFLRAYRKERNTPIILLTARLEEADKVLGLELGADDYVTKPFGIRELVARIRAVLRRAAPEASQPAVLRGGDLLLDLTAHTVHLGDQPMRLTPSEFELLATLMATPGRAFHAAGTARKTARDRHRRGRAHGELPYPQPARQDRAGTQPPSLHRGGVRGGVSVSGRVKTGVRRQGAGIIRSLLVIRVSAFVFRRPSPTKGTPCAPSPSN